MRTPEERAKAAAYQKKWAHEHPERLAATAARHKAKALAELATNPDDPRHGRTATYVIGCRCGLCRAAHTAYVAGWRVARRAAA